jgi:hypothetical protein
MEKEKSIIKPINTVNTNGAVAVLCFDLINNNINSLNSQSWLHYLHKSALHRYSWLFSMHRDWVNESLTDSASAKREQHWAHVQACRAAFQVFCLPCLVIYFRLRLNFGSSSLPPTRH